MVSWPVACIEVWSASRLVPRLVDLRTTQPCLSSTTSTPAPDGVAAANSGVKNTTSLDQILKKANRHQTSGTAH
jgi:hypothetical protein